MCLSKNVYEDCGGTFDFITDMNYYSFKVSTKRAYTGEHTVLMFILEFGRGMSFLVAKILLFFLCLMTFMMFYITIYSLTL